MAIPRVAPPLAAAPQAAGLHECGARAGRSMRRNQVKSMQDPSRNINIRRGNTEEIIDLRHEILRTGLPRESAYFKGDNEPTTIHVVAELDGKIVGCATMLQRRWEQHPAWQLRGMAVAPLLRKTGIGSKLLNEIE